MINLLIKESFKRVPQITRKIEKKVFSLDAPSQNELKENMPLLISVLPMAMMSMISVINSVNVINGILGGDKTVDQAMPSLIVSGLMILSMILYPIISNIYNKHRQSKRETTKRK